MQWQMSFLCLLVLMLIDDNKWVSYWEILLLAWKVNIIRLFFCFKLRKGRFLELFLLL